MGQRKTKQKTDMNYVVYETRRNRFFCVFFTFYFIFIDNFGEGMIQNLLFLTIDYSAAGSWIIFAAKRKSNNTCILYVLPGHSSCLLGVSDDEVMLSVFRCQLTY